MKDQKEKFALNAICPYFTMFPITFPYSILKNYYLPSQWVLDPFCGRGTTNYAARCLGIPSIGIDSSPVAVALSRAKLANTTIGEIVESAKNILSSHEKSSNIPSGEFWERAYHKQVLRVLCRFRDSLKNNCSTDSRIALRAIIMGALHGPIGKICQSYFSNQCPRTYAPKPGYAIRFWRKNKLPPPKVDVLNIIKIRACRYFEDEKEARGQIISGNSCNIATYAQIKQRFSCIITSPPYFGMSTYLPDQWLRLWFLGGKSEVDYSENNQICHSKVDSYIHDLNSVWKQAAKKCNPSASLVVRIGSINSRKVDTKTIIRESLKDSGWKLATIKTADSANNGKRQALHFLGKTKRAPEEFDFWARLN